MRTLPTLMLLTLLAPAGLYAQDSTTPASKPTAQSQPATQHTGVRKLTQPELDAIRDHVQPLVEKHAGRKFTSKPKVVLAHNSTVGRILNRELKAQFTKQFPNLTKSELKRVVAASASAMALGLLGKIDTQTQALYILPGMFDILTKSKLIPAEEERNLLTLVVAHELTHLLQDDVFHLEKSLGALGDQAELHAFNGAIEGHATYVQNQVGKDLGLDAAAQAYRDLLLGSKKSATLAFGNSYARALPHIYYSLGAEFFETLVTEGGTDAAWKFFENPPKQSTYLFDHGSWDPKTVPQVNKDPQRLAALAKFFGKRPRRIMASTADQALLRSFLVKAPREQVDKILQPLQRAWFVQVGILPSMGLTLAMEFEDAASAKRYFEQVPAKVLWELNSNSGYKTQLSTEALRADAKAAREAELGMKETSLTYTFRKGKFGQVQGLLRWHQHDRYVIQIDTRNLRTTPTQLDAMAKIALELLRKP